MKNNKLAFLVYILLIIIFCGGILGLFICPFIYNLIGISHTKFFDQSILYIVTFYLCYITALIIIATVISIFKAINKGTPFKKSVGNKIKLLAILFIILSLIILFKCIFIPTILTLAFGLICFIVGLCFYVLYQVFKVAISYKNEIDYTI